MSRDLTALWLALVALICGLNRADAVECNYMEHWWWGYSCELSEISYLERTEEFTLEGQHLLDHGDDDVVTVFTTNSNCSFIPDLVLKKFASVKALLLSQSRIEDIEGAFEVCDKIELMTFYRNKLTRIASRNFVSCSSLKSLDLGSNEISELPVDAFDGLDLLETLDLQNNPIKVLPLGIFSHLVNMEFLWLGQIAVGEMNSLHFRHMKKLKTFGFGSRSPESIPRVESGAFKAMHDLEFIYIENENELPMEIERLAFEDLPSLMSLKIVGSAVRRLNRNSFSALPNVLWLSIENNEIAEIERNFFSLFPRLERVHAENNFCVNGTFLVDDESFLQDFEECFKAWDDATPTTTSAIPSTSTTVTQPSTTPTTLSATSISSSLIIVFGFSLVLSLLQIPR